MTNWEKYKDEMTKYNAMHREFLSCIVAKKFRGQDRCESVQNCKECLYLNTQWLDAEYEEPQTDWGKVKQGTKVYSKETNRYVGIFVAEYRNCIVISTGDDGKFIILTYLKNDCKVKEDKYND